MPRSPATHARSPAWALALGLVALAALPARAHDYWLEFQPLHLPHPAVNSAVSLWLGEDFIPEAQTAIEPPAPSPCATSPAPRRRPPPRARDGVAPLLRLGLAAPGGHLLALERGPPASSCARAASTATSSTRASIDALAERKLSGERWRRGTERYTRYLKAFVQVGDDADGVSTRVLGQRLEVVPERDLATVKVGERLGVRVLFEGRPLAGAAGRGLRARRRGAPRTGPGPGDGRAGRAEFTVDEPGNVADPNGAHATLHRLRRAQWESFWAALQLRARLSLALRCAHEPCFGQSLTFPRPDGQSAPGHAFYGRRPEAPAIVLIQEWWGINEQIRGVARRLADAGYNVLIPDLYRGKLATASDEAQHLMSSLNFPDALFQDLAGAVRPSPASTTARSRSWASAWAAPSPSPPPSTSRPR
jgi:hypothetical protein